IRNQALLPLPLESRTVLGRPAISNPIGILVGWIAAGATGETNDHLHIQLLSKQHRSAKSFCVAVGDSLVGINRVAMAAQRRDLDVVVVKLFSPRLQLGVVSEQLLHRTVLVPR